MKVIKLEVSNFLGVKAIEISPDGSIVKIEGKNGAGKSSVIDAIWAAIGGAMELPEHPIRNKEKDARIFVDLGEINITRKFTENGTYLEVRNSDGLKFPAPQQVLDKLFTKVSMDPQAFIDLRPRDRRELLLDITGQKADIERLDAERQSAYDNRTLVNRDIKTLEGKLEGVPADEKVEEKSAKDLFDRLDEARALSARKNAYYQEAEGYEGYADQNQETMEGLQQKIKEFTQQIEELKKEIIEEKKGAAESRKKSDNITLVDTAPIQEEIDGIDAHNEKARTVKAARELRQELNLKSKESNQLTAAIQDKGEMKLSLLKSSRIPIDNLIIEGDSILIGEVPFDDLSSSEQLWASMKLGMALNPKLRVLRIARGSELDSDSMAEITAFAKEHDCQIWIEIVTDGPQDGIFIEKGEVKCQ